MAVKVCPECGARYGAERVVCQTDGRTLRRERESDPMYGDVVGGYRVRRTLGDGGMGRVYLAEQVASGRLCALKVMNQAVVADGDAMRRFQREAANHAALGRHPHVAELYDFGSAPNGKVFIAMEYVEGEPLTRLLERHAWLAPPRAIEIARQLAAGLGALHALGLVHRDVKPDNIMVATRDGADHATLLDFGIAKRPRDLEQKVTRTGFAVGTPQYMSPEQVAADAVDARSDIYSLGLVTFVMLAGALPFRTGPAMSAFAMRLPGQLRALRDVRPDVAWPAPLQTALDRALASTPEHRHQTVQAFAEELASVRSGVRGSRFE